MIIIVILAVNHFSVLYLLCFSTVVIKSKSECHPELSRALFTKAKEYHVSDFDKLLSLSKTTKSHIIAFSQKYNNNTSHPFHGSVLFPPVTFPGTEDIFWNSATTPWIGWESGGLVGGAFGQLCLSGIYLALH